MNKRNDPKNQPAPLPNGQRVRIESLEGDSALVRRIGGTRRGTLAVCPIDRLRPV